MVRVVTDLCDRPARLAVELLRHGARFVVVGSAARWLRSGEGTPRDLDVAVDRPDLPLLVGALAALGVRSSAARFARAAQCRVDTSWGPLDVFVGGPPASHGVPFRLSRGQVVLPVVAP